MLRVTHTTRLLAPMLSLVMFLVAAAVSAATQAQVNGQNVNAVDFGQGGRKLGEYRQSGTQWVEANAAGTVTFRFEETQRDEWSVYLLDRSRRVNIQLDLHTRKVMYSDANSPRRALYDVLAARGPSTTAAVSPGTTPGAPSVAVATPAPTSARTFPETYRSPITLGAPKVGPKPRTFDQYAWLTSHNAFVNYTDARWTTPNQSRGIIGQIETDGVRGLMFDVYNFSGSADVTCGLSFGSDCYPAGIYLCHGGCSGFPGATYALPRQNLKDALDNIGDWLGKHRELTDVITIMFEDYTSPGTLATVIQSSKAANYIFNPYAYGVESKGFPTLEYMQATNQRLLILTSKFENKNQSLGIVYDRDFTVENYWSIGVGGANYECKTRWDSVPLNKTQSGFKRLFVMNHFRNVPNTGTATFDNSLSKLNERLGICRTAAGRLPNYLALDYVELGSGKALVESINAEWAKQAVY